MLGISLDLTSAVRRGLRAPIWPLFVKTSEFTKANWSGAATESISVVSRDSDTQFTVAAGKGSIMTAGGALALYDASADRYYSYGIKTIASDVVTIHGTLPATVTSCEPMPDSVNGQHLSRHGYNGLADYIAEQVTKFAYKRSPRLFEYHAPILTTPAFNNPDIYALDAVTKVIDVTQVGGAVAGGFVAGTTNLSKLCQQQTVNVNQASNTLSQYLSRFYLVQDSGAGKGIEFSFDAGGKTGFMEIPVSAARVTHSTSQITEGRVRLEVEADGVSIFDQTYDPGPVNFAYIEFTAASTIKVRMTCADSVPTSARLLGVYAWEQPAAGDTGFFQDGDVVGFLGDSWTQFPGKIGAEVPPLRPDGTAGEAMQFLSERLRERLADMGTTITTKNYGKSGTTTAWGLYWVDEMIAAEPAMTHCVVNFWVNDHNSNGTAGGTTDTAYDFDPANKWAFKLQSAGGLKGSVTYAQWLTNLSAICDALIAANIQPIVLMPGHTGSSAGTQSIQQNLLNKIAAGFVTPV